MAVQYAKLQGLPLLAKARELGISRNTLRRYPLTLTPPADRPRHVPEEPTRESLT